MLEYIKLALRIGTDAFDTELETLIKAAELDLSISGIAPQDSPDELYKEAVKRYVKMYFGQPDDFDRMHESYEMLKKHLAVATGYRMVNDG